MRNEAKTIRRRRSGSRSGIRDVAGEV
jgi:hypothetical protein